MTIIAVDDFIASHDMEDIITLLDGRPEMVEEVKTAPEDFNKYLIRKFGEFPGLFREAEVIRHPAPENSPYP